MRVVVLVALMISGCGESAPERQEEPEAAAEVVSEPEELEPIEATPEDPEPDEPETTSLPAGENPIFTTIHRCDPATECEIAIARVDGVNFVELGHGHAAPPAVRVEAEVRSGRLRVFTGDGAASVEVLEGSPAQLSATGLRRHALFEGAYYVALEGEDARGVVLRLAPGE